MKALFEEYTPWGMTGKKPVPTALTEALLSDVNFMQGTLQDTKGALTFAGDTDGVFVSMKAFGYKGKGVDIDAVNTRLAYRSPLVLGRHFTIEIMEKFGAGIRSKKRYEEMIDTSDLAPIFKTRLKEIEGM